MIRFFKIKQCSCLYLPELIRFLEHTELDRASYDNCVSNSTKPSPYALSWYLDIVAEGKWGALVNGDYTAVFPICFRNRRGSQMAYQPLFTQQLGALGANSEIDPLSFLKALPTRFRSLELNLFAGHQILEDPFGRNRLSTIEGVTHHLQLNQEHALLHKAFSENTRRNIRKAKKSGLVVSLPENPKDFGLDAFMAILMENQAPGIKGLSEKDYQRIPKLIEACAARGAAHFVRVEQEGKMVAGLFFMAGFGWLINLFGASSAAARKTGAMAYGMDAFIAKHTPSSQVIDFEGSMIPGIARFYRSFGSEVVHFPRIRTNRFSLLQQLLNCPYLKR